MKAIYWHLTGVSTFKTAELVQILNDFENNSGRPLLFSLNVISHVLMSLAYIKATKIVPYDTISFYVASIDKAQFHSNDLTRLNIMLNETADTKKAYDDALRLFLNQRDNKGEATALPTIMDDFEEMGRLYKSDLNRKDIKKKKKKENAKKENTIESSINDNLDLFNEEAVEEE